MLLRGFLVASAIIAAGSSAVGQVKRQSERIGGDGAVVEFTLPDGKKASAAATVILDSAGTPIGPAARDQSVPLATANAPSGPATLYGGNYILTQLCTGYGSVALRYRAPDGATMVTLTTKSGPDAAGTLLQFGSGQVVDVALASTTGCNVILSRIP